MTNIDRRKGGKYLRGTEETIEIIQNPYKSLKYRC